MVATLCLFALVAGSGHAATLASESTWGGAQSEGARGVEAASAGSTYLVGRTFSFDPFERPYVFALRYAQDGSLVWERAWDGPEQFGNDEGSDVAVAADGSVYVSGSTIGVGGDALLLKLSPDGSLRWQRRWGGNANESGESVALGPDGSIYLAEQRISPGSGQGVAVELPRDGPVRPREPEQPRQDPAARRARVRRADPMGGGLGRTLSRDRELVVVASGAVEIAASLVGG